MLAVNPYLNFNGNTEEVFNFYKSVFGGEFVTMQRFKDTAEAGNVPPEAQDMIMHVALRIGKNILMGTDAPDCMGFNLVKGTNITLAIGTTTKQEADDVFTKLGAGGTVTMPLADTFWGAYFGMCTDKFGIQWMISHDPNHLPE